MSAIWFARYRKYTSLTELKWFEASFIHTVQICSCRHMAHTASKSNNTKTDQSLLLAVWKGQTQPLWPYIEHTQMQLHPSSPVTITYSLSHTHLYARTHILPRPLSALCMVQPSVSRWQARSADLRISSAHAWPPKGSVQLSQSVISCARRRVGSIFHT
jgi:hypothetical protein